MIQISLESNATVSDRLRVVCMLSSLMPFGIWKGSSISTDGRLSIAQKKLFEELMEELSILDPETFGRKNTED